MSNLMTRAGLRRLGSPVRRHSQDSRQQMDNVKPYSEIPGPKPLPVIGNIWRYFPHIGEYSFDKIHRSYQRMFRQFGPLVKERIVGQKELVHVFDPDDIMKVYRNDGLYPQRLSHQALAKYRRDRPHLYGSVGLFPSNGKEWHRFRRLFQKILLDPSVAKSYSSALEDVTDDFVGRIRDILDSKREVDLQPELFKWAIECVGAIALNRRLGCLRFKSSSEAQKLVKAAHDTHYAVYITETSPFFKYFDTPSYKKLVAAQDYLADTIQKYIKEAMSKDGEAYIENSVLHRMLQVKEADFKDVFTMVVDMFMAGIDTTAYTTAFALYNLAKNPSVQEKLRSELVQSFPQKTTPMSEKLDTLSYLNNVIKESLRVNPVALGNGRVLAEDLVLSNYRVPAGTHVILQHQAASVDERNFPEPLRFLPERWEKGARGPRDHHPFASAPFGAGPRVCVGRRFAQREMMFALSKVVRNFIIEYHYEDIDSQIRLINVPDKPLQLRFHDAA